VNSLRLLLMPKMSWDASSSTSRWLPHYDDGEWCCWIENNM
jgi:hypothetical protein